MKILSSIGLTTLTLMLLSPLANADTRSTAEMICNDGTREGDALESCINEQVEDMEEAETSTSAEEICAGLEEEAYRECMINNSEEDYTTGPQNMPSTESSGDAPPRITMPTIPKPALLPGPDEDSGAKDVQHYFRNKAIPGFTAGFIGLIGGMAIIALVWSGIRFISAGGEEEAITSAKKTATWAIAGFAIAILSYAIVSIITSIKYPNETTPSGAPAEEESVIYKNN